MVKTAKKGNKKNIIQTFWDVLARRSLCQFLESSMLKQKSGLSENRREWSEPTYKQPQSIKRLENIEIFDLSANTVVPISYRLKLFQSTAYETPNIFIFSSLSMLCRHMSGRCYSILSYLATCLVLINKGCKVSKFCQNCFLFCVTMFFTEISSLFVVKLRVFLSQYACIVFHMCEGYSQKLNIMYIYS